METWNGIISVRSRTERAGVIGVANDIKLKPRVVAGDIKREMS
jgi:hypothetical protein